MAQVGAFALLGVLFLMCDVQTAEASILTKPANNLGIVAYYPFKEGSGSTTSDYSGQNLNATLTTAPAWTASGKFGYGLDFTAGSLQYLSVPHNAALNFSYAMTYAAWIKPTLGTQVSLISKGAYGDAFRVLIQGGTAGERVPAIQIDGATIYGTTPIVSGNWTHVAFTYDGVNTKIYVNGALTDSSVSANGILATTATTMYIGQGGSDNIYYNGVMDEVYLFQRALSGAEISTLYARVPTGGRQRTIASKQSYNDGLVFYAPLDDAEGTTARNYGKISGTGTLTNFALTGSTSNWVAGKRGGALDFDGTNDIVNIGPKIGIYDLTTDLSAFIWLKTTDTAWDAFGSLHGNGGWGVGTGGCSAGIIGGYIGSVWRCASTAVNDGAWHHVGVTLDSASGGTLKYYIDGVQNGSTVTSAGAFRTPAVSGSTGLNIGDEQTNSRPFAGQLDEARLYNRVLTSTEVAQLYADTGLKKLTVSTSQNTVAPANLVLWHTFDGAYLNTTTSTDRGSSQKDFTLVGDAKPIMGKIGQAIYFDGTNDRIKTASPLSLADDTAWTISLWINPAEVNASIHGIYGNLYTTNNHTRFDIQPNQTYEFVNDANGFMSSGPTLFFTPNQWSLLTIVCNGANSSNILFYQNGVYLGAGTLADSSQTISAFGDIAASTFNYGFYGSMDDIRVYNKALSSAEVLSLFTTGGATDSVDATGPTVSGESRTNPARCFPYVTYLFSWTTNELSNTIVEYGLTSSYGSTVTNSVLATSHGYSIDLSPSTLYYYRVKSVDSSGNAGYGAASSFTTTTTIACGGGP
jgi:hypothetical protein